MNLIKNLKRSLAKPTVQSADETAPTDQNPKGSTTIAVGATYG
jgi:hypothetical protein